MGTRKNFLESCGQFGPRLPKGSPALVYSKVLPRTVHEGPEGEYRYSSTLSLSTAIDRGWVVNATPWPLTPGKRPGSHCREGWVGPTAGLDECRRSRSHRYSIPGPSSPEQNAVTTTPPRPTNRIIFQQFVTKFPPYLGLSMLTMHTY
jgi:hypothetical protein